ncbi:hypothetical protein J7T55_007202 [Diaporthe amygdali]|uniref:uncharacterized protein n=1 Tax=Phomopsis amygdali TaxID=1214568 RepID=UPI0022FEE01F|nr:uncharacterized protein J7T55_007202 [Diaporthe amygdali]KAJ0108083.1 hypothetical protein J7T55_007202 [Diaporthe amygdali]
MSNEWLRASPALSPSSLLYMVPHRRYDQAVREWQKDPGWSDRLHRINIDLGEEPPMLDAVDKVKSLVQNTRRWLQDKDEKCRIHAIECELVASTFYFERRGNAGKDEGSPIHVKGVIGCRIFEMAEVMAPGKFLLSYIYDPTLFVINKATQDKVVEMPIKTMVLYGLSDLVEVDITVLEEAVLTSIDLKLEREGLRDQRLYRLSLFLRKLIKQDSK